MASGLQGQQATQYSLYMLNPLRWNAAYAGLDRSLVIDGGIRQQWVGLEGSPTSQIVTMHAPLNIVSSGIGLQFENDNIGASRRTQAGVSYAYHLQLGGGTLSLGGRAQWLQWNLDGRVLRTPGGIYMEPGLDHQDDVLSISAETATTTTFGAGLYYKSEVVEVGFSVENVSEPVVQLSSFDFPLSRTYYASAAAHLNLSSILRLHPSVWVRSDIVQTQTDFSLLLEYNDNIFGGASLRGYSDISLDALAIIAGFRLNDNIRVAYAYDVGLSSLRGTHSGSHEIGITYDLRTTIGVGIPPPIIYHPRTKQ